MSISNVSIANRALTLLSVDRVQSLTDESSEQARKVNAVFTDTRDALLEEHNWNFARKERTLSLLADGPLLDGYSYAYQLPSDCIRVIRMNNEELFAVYGKAIYTNSNDPRVEYISLVSDPTKFSKGFIKALASRLAADLAFGFTQNATLATNMDAVAQRDLREAKWSDAQEGQSINIIRGSMIAGT
jgi:hypothetical protein